MSFCINPTKFKNIRNKITSRILPVRELPRPLPPVPSTESASASIDLLKGVPGSTLLTDVLAWTPIVFGSTAAEDLGDIRVLSVIHKKRQVQRYQHEFLLIAFTTPTGRTMYATAERGMAENSEPHAAKTQGQAKDYFSLLSVEDLDDCRNAQTLRSLRWDNSLEPRPPPLLDVIQLLCLFSGIFPVYSVGLHSCYHYAATLCHTMRIYRPPNAGAPTSDDGNRAFKTSRFILWKVIQKESIRHDGVLIALAFLHVRLGWITPPVPQAVQVQAVPSSSRKGKEVDRHA